MKGRLLLALTALALPLSRANAIDWSVNAHVQVIEVTYSPSQINFQIDQAAGNCGAGSWIFFYPSGATVEEKAANASAILSALMSAQESRRQVTVIGINSGCVAQFLYKL